LAPIPVASPDRPPTVENLSLTQGMNPSPDATRPDAVVSWEGTVAAGHTIVLNGERSRGAGLSYLWTQTQGPAVTLDNPKAASARFTVPEGASRFEFVLSVGNASGLASASVTVAAEAPEGLVRTIEEPPHADAGDDLIGLVGRQLTLNGSRSLPAGRVGYRWVQTGGPAVRLKVEEGAIYSFVPHAPGVYRFALVVAAGDRISEPDTVQVTVGSGRGVSGEAIPNPPAQSPEVVARTALASVRGAVAHAEELAQILIQTADRMDLYGNYTEAFSEMSRRFEPLLPEEASRRAAWNERLFAPLTACLVEEMRTEGLDLSQPAGRTAPLTPTQSARLAELLRAMAEGFRDVPASKPMAPDGSRPR
jgi:hypothetical protein